MVWCKDGAVRNQWTWGLDLTLNLLCDCEEAVQPQASVFSYIKMQEGVKSDHLKD